MLIPDTGFDSNLLHTKFVINSQPDIILHETYLRFCNPNFLQPPNIEQNPDWDLFSFLISGPSGQILLEEKLSKVRTSNGIDMKLGPIFKLGREIR